VEGAAGGKTDNPNCILRPDGIACRRIFEFLESALVASSRPTLDVSPADGRQDSEYLRRQRRRAVRGITFRKYDTEGKEHKKHKRHKRSYYLPSCAFCASCVPSL